MKPILFNTEMVQAILAGTKTVTRRLIKPQFPTYQDREHGRFSKIELYGRASFLATHEEKPTIKTILHSPVLPGDILYVRETWSTKQSNNCYIQPCHGGVCPHESCDLANGPCFPDEYIYKATDILPAYGGKWRPSIHMPKEAARIFLRVTDVGAEQLNHLTVADLQKEGIVPDGYIKQYTVMTTADEWFGKWKKLWESTIKPSDFNRYGWDANPWVWVISFERCEKPDGWPE